MKKFSYMSHIHRSVLASTTAIGMTLAASGAIAQANTATFDIPAQPISSALLQYGVQVKKEIVASDKLLTGLRSSAVNGRYDTAEALNKLLAGTNLRAVYIDANTISVAPADTSKKASPAPRPKNPVVAADDRGNDTARVSASEEFDEIIVNSKRIASTATKFQLNVIDTPQSIKAITPDVIDMASIRQIQDLTKVDASTTTKGVDNGTQQLSFRGFDVDSGNGMLIDGVRTQTSFSLDLGVFERIEILKGPSSSIYGTNAVGGMINSITKQPSATPGVMAAVQMGSFDFFRFEGDATGPLTEDNRLTYRVYGAYENGGDFVDYAHNEAKAVYGALRYELTDATTVDFSAHYQTRTFPANGGIAPFYPSEDTQKIEIPDVPTSRLAGSRDTKRQGDFLAFRSVVTHNFADDWKLKFTAQYSDSQVEGGSAVIFDWDGIPANGDINNVFLNYGGGSDVVWGGDLSLFGDFELFGRSHSIFISADYRKAVSDGFQVFAGSALMPGEVFNLFNPDYTIFRRPVETALDFSGYPGGVVYNTDLEIMGGTVQAMLHPTDRLTFLLSGRFDHQKQVDKFNGADEDNPVLVNGEVALGFPGAPSVWNVSTFTPQVGGTFAVAENVNLYATYGESFVPQVGYTWDGRAWRPENGWQVEGGIKGGFLDNNITLSLAAFHMVRGNILGADVNAPPGVFGTIEIGEQRSRGVELEAFGTLTPGWTFIASAAYLDVTFSKADNELDIGARVANAPRYAFALFTSYEVQKGPLAGLGFSGGISNKSDRVWGQASAIGRPPVAAGGYTTADVRAFYQMGKLLFDVRVNNIWNEKYYNTQDGNLRGRLFAGRPREVIAGIKYKF